MVADLVDEHVGDDVAERFLVLRPVIEDRAAVEGNAVRHLAGLDGEALADAAALEQAEQVEGRFERHVLEDVVAREFGDLDDEVARQRAELFRQVTIGLQRQRFERADGRGMAVAPILGLVNAGHGLSFARHIDDFQGFSRVQLQSARLRSLKPGGLHSIRPQGLSGCFAGFRNALSENGGLQQFVIGQFDADGGRAVHCRRTVRC